MNEIKKRSDDINSLLSESTAILQELSYDKQISPDEFNKLFNDLTNLRTIRIKSNKEDIELHETVKRFNNLLITMRTKAKHSHVK